MHQSRGTVLIIDDDPFFLKLLSDAFEEFGYTAFAAIDGIEGVKVFLEKRPDAVISDLVMPRMGGVSTCMEIRRLAGEEPPVLVMLTSMFHEPAHEHSAPEMGASVHIPKATNPVDIVIILEQLMERKKFQNL
jgi:two-component system, OmpR family, response regulator